MARPRLIKLPDGEVTLQGFTTEQADKIESMLTSPLDVKCDATNSKHWEGVGLGMTYNKERKMYEIAEFRYNPTTHEVVLIDMKDAGEYKAFAVNNFRVSCVDKGLV